MKKQKINTSLPAYLYDFATETDEKFSRAKLKVFYVGETADHRLFTEQFAKKLVKTLPYTPVVTQYDAEKDDFNGHAVEQNIYGIVDPCGKVSFEQDDSGKTWAICDIVLYTERKDMVGTIAKKIPGKAQSLEMDPKTVQYVINYDKKMKVKNIEFTNGEFVGVSVLGDKQQPAFTGSAFFSSTDFQHKMEILKDYCLNKEERGNDMDETILNFLALSWGEKSKAIYSALEASYGEGCVYIVDFYDDNVVADVYYPQTGEVKLNRVYYSIENEQVVLGDAEEVRIVYEKVVQPSENVEDATVLENIEEEVEQPIVEECAAPEQPVEEATEVEQQAEEMAVEEPVETEPKQEMVEAEAEVVEPVEVETEATEEEPAVENAEEVVVEEDAAPVVDEPEENPAEEEVENSDLNNEEGEETDSNEETTNPSTLTDSERQEFEDLRKEKKLNLISSYNEDLDEAILNDFTARIDSFTVEDLENELAKAYRKASKTMKKNLTQMRTFSITPVVAENEQSSLAKLVNKYK